DHAEVAMVSLAWVHEEARCARAGERRGDLLADDAGLAHSAHDGAAARAEDLVHRLREAFVDLPGERADRIGLDAEDAPCRGDMVDGFGGGIHPSESPVGRGPRPVIVLPGSAATGR